MKRYSFTIDPDLHTRIKVQCAIDHVTIADLVRNMLDRECAGMPRLPERLTRDHRGRFQPGAPAKHKRRQPSVAAQLESTE